MWTVLVLSRGVDSDDVDNLGMTPLMVAAMTNREANVDLLLKTAKESKMMLTRMFHHN